MTNIKLNEKTILFKLYEHWIKTMVYALHKIALG